MRVLVTGGHGFLGTHVRRLLSARGDQVLCPSSQILDLRDPHAVQVFVLAHHPDLILHLAARVGGIGANQRHPGTFFYDNMAMGLSVLEAARQAQTPKVVITGTVCAYPKFTPVPFKEDALWDGYPEETNAPYGIAKRSLLVMAQAYRQEFGSNFVMVFPVNLYGPGDNFNLESSHVIPGMIRRVLEAKNAQAPTVTLWGDGSPTREFLYVVDAAKGVLAAADLWNDPAPINLGTGVEISMASLAQEIAKQTGYPGQILWDTTKPNGQPRRQLDVSRAKQCLGWVAETSLISGLQQTIAWYTQTQ